METIVQQIIVELGRNICKRIEEEGLSDMDQVNGKPVVHGRNF